MIARTLLVPALLVAAGALCGCRSDGGFGRKDNARSMAWAADRIAARTAEDMDRTAENIAGTPAAVSRSVGNSMERMGDTYRLYFEGTEQRR